MIKQKQQKVDVSFWGDLGDNIFGKCWPIEVRFVFITTCLLFYWF